MDWFPLNIGTLLPRSAPRSEIDGGGCLGCLLQCLIWGELRGSQERGLEHRSTWGFEHVKNWKKTMSKPVVTYKPHSLGPPEFPLEFRLLAALLEGRAPCRWGRLCMFSMCCFVLFVLLCLLSCLFVLGGAPCRWGRPLPGASRTSRARRRRWPSARARTRGTSLSTYAGLYIYIYIYIYIYTYIYIYIEREIERERDVHMCRGAPLHHLVADLDAEVLRPLVRLHLRGETRTCF